MNLRGQDVASSVREWIKEDIKRGPSTRHDLGKFFVGVSTGTLGLFATLLKLTSEEVHLDGLLIGTFVFLLASVIVGLILAIPNITRVKENLELYSEYNKIVTSIVTLLILWFLLWTSGFLFGAARLFR